MLKRVVVVIALVLAGTGTLYASRSMTLAYVGAKDSQMHIAADAFAAVVGSSLPGRFRFEEKGGTTLGGEMDIWNAVKLGVVEMAILTTAGIESLAPQLGVLSLPYLFRDAAHADKVLDGEIGRTLSDSIEDQGVLSLGFAEQGFRQLTNSRHPIQRPADMVGLNIRVIPNSVYEETFKAFGATVVPMPWPAVYGALRDGRIDGQENPILTISSEHLEDVQKFITLTGHFYSPLILIINIDFYKGLKPEEKEIFKEAAHAAAAVSRRIVREREKSIVASFKEKGITVTETIDRDAFMAAILPLWPEWEKRFGTDLIKSIREAK